MTGITHKQAKRYLRADADGLLTEDQRRDIDAHLRECETCRVESEELSKLTSRLQSGFHARWDVQDGPSKNVMANVRSQTRRIIMSNRISFGLRALAGIAAVLIFGLLINSAISQMRDQAVAAKVTATPDSLMPVSPQAGNRLLAFTMEEDGNFDIYTIHADGSGLTNLTNDPARDVNPVWSPDGRRIAFESDRTGFMQIYLMDADGSNVIQITNDEADHSLPMNMDGKFDPWSPDGSELLFLQSNPGNETWTLISQNINNGNRVSLARDRFFLNGNSWSPDGKYIGYVLNNTSDTNSFAPDIYIVDADGGNPRELKKLIPQNEKLDSRYHWSSDGGSVIITTTQNGPQQTVYEFNPETGTLQQKDILNVEVLDWGEEVSLVLNVEKPKLSLNWRRPDGTGNTFDTGVNALFINFRRSKNGNFAIGAYCDDGQFRLYWSNPDGSTVKQLLDFPTDRVEDSGDISWSPDGQYVAFNVATSNETKMYILNVENALNDPSIQPEQVVIGKGVTYQISSWQPVLAEEIVDEKPIAQGENRLVAFTMEKDGNLDIYTVRADGTDLTDLTNSPEREDNPYWSPDGKRIAFNGTIKDQQQIFMMDANGSNIIQLTDDGLVNRLVSFEDGRESGFDAWSPDGKKLVFVKFNLLPAKDGEWIKLYTLDVETKIQTPLTDKWGVYMSPAWSPDGEHVAFTSITVNELGEPDHISIQMVNADGSSLVDLTESLPDDEIPSMTINYWSRDGQSIIFIAHGIASDKGKVYEARLDASLIEHISGHGGQLLDWWNGITLLQESRERTALTWLRGADGTFTLDTCGTWFSSRRSNTGDLFFGIYCPDSSNWMIYLANEDGSRVEQLLDAPIAFVGGGMTAAWSPDNQFIAFNLSSQYKTEMYILDVTGALNDPSIQPFSIDVGQLFTEGDSISWQPVIIDEVVEEKPTPIVETPEPSPQTDNRLIAFTSAVENGNLDTYTMQPDGGALTNLTNNPAHDINPYWSPDGSRIAFMSDREGFMHLFIMNADGSGVTQVTNDQADHEFSVSNHSPWSPDGNRLLFTEKAPGDENWMLYAVDVDGQNKIPLAKVFGPYNFPSWAPDGQHVAFLVLKPQNGPQEREVFRIHVMDANGNNQTDTTKLLPVDEDLGGNYS